MTLRVLSVCSGAGTCALAWAPLGWTHVAFAETDAFCSRLLAERFPAVPNLGDMTAINGASYGGAIDVLMGGTPCQGFSIAGNRQGLADPRSGLARSFVALASETRPRWLVWENVPGAFQTARGRDFGSFIGALAECGYSLAWRVLDARFFGVPQRRRRVFLVGYFGTNSDRPAAVLFEPESSPGNIDSRQAERAKAPAGIAGDTTSRRIIGALSTKSERDACTGEGHPYVTPYDAAQVTSPHNRARCAPGDPLPTLNGSARVSVAVCDPILATEGNTYSHEGANNFRLHNVLTSRKWARRLTPRECERAQGMPDDWTRIGKAADAPRYRAIGNAIAVPVLAWIGRRIAAQELQP